VLRLSEQYLFALGDYEKALRYSHAEPHLVLYGQALTYEALSRPLLAQNALARAIKVSPDFQPARDKLLALAGPEAVDLATDGGNAMLDESQQASLARQRDELLTASLSGARPDVTAIPTELPAAVEPPQELVEREVQAPEAVTATDEPRIEPTGETTRVAALEVAARVQPEAEAEPARTELEGWMVQLSSQRNEDAAWTAWEQLSKRHGELLGGRDAAVVRAELDGKGIYYRLRVHRLQSRDEARSLCSRLKARGTSCYFGRAES
jgi:tetratricopeptide (TPR) repeat protein